jgi:hypothetical protein
MRKHLLHVYIYLQYGPAACSRIALVDRYLVSSLPAETGQLLP